LVKSTVTLHFGPLLSRAFELIRKRDEIFVILSDPSLPGERIEVSFGKCKRETGECVGDESAGGVFGYGPNGCSFCAGDRKSRWGDELTAGKMKKCVWLRPEAVVQVEFLEWTGADRLRHSKFVVLRAWSGRKWENHDGTFAPQVSDWPRRELLDETVISADCVNQFGEQFGFNAYGIGGS
jgi:ATP dependent DNA ligase C terminal region